jgi:hypothetical protein
MKMSRANQRADDPGNSLAAHLRRSRRAISV